MNNDNNKCKINGPTQANGGLEWGTPLLYSDSRLLARATREEEKQDHAPAQSLADASGGWMSEKTPLLRTAEKCFLLTSPFIEPAMFSSLKHPG